jgi:hypothetical protein
MDTDSDAVVEELELETRDIQENDVATIAHFELRAPLAEKVLCEKPN